MKRNRESKTTGVLTGKRSHIVVAAVALALLLMIAPLYVFADNSSQATTPLGLSSTQLGASTIYSIYSASDMQLARELHVNGDYSKVVLHIEQDFAVGDVDNWVPLGSSEEPLGASGYPFNGTIDGKGYSIAGVGEKSNATLLGYLKNATIENITVYSALPVTEANPYYGLLDSAENSTIINCHILPLNSTSTMALRSLRIGITADTFWLTDAGPGGGSSPNPVADTPGKLWAMAEGVAAGTHTFASKTVTIRGSINCENQPFPGIGNEEAPFKGSILGSNAVITNLNLTNTNAVGTGLISYADPTGLVSPDDLTTIDGIRIENVSGSGNDATGALLGYGKDVIVKNSSVSGKVSGGNDVGSLVGKLVLTAPFKHNDGGPDLKAEPYILNCYSTADIFGTVNVGGIVGNVSIDDHLGIPSQRANNSDVIIENCFTTGIINANSQVGGIVGFLDNMGLGVATDFAFAVKNSGSMSSINASVNVGGIVGMAPFEFDGANSGPSVISSYFSGAIAAMNYTGGLIGFGGGARDSYVSGNVVSPLAFSFDAASSVWPLAGNATAVSLTGSYVVPDAVFRPGDPLNTGAYVTANSGPYLGLFGAGGDLHKPAFSLVGYNFFATGNSAPNGFTASNLNVASGNITGTFPRLSSFPAGSAYSSFSTISTDATVATFPSQLYVNTNKEATRVPGGAALELPNNIGVTWKIGDSTSYEQADKTINGDKNIVKIENGKLKLTDKVNKAFDIVIIGETTSGISLKFSVTLMDEAVRTVRGELSEMIITEPNPALITQELLLEANMISLTLDEGVQLTNPVLVPVKLVLTEYGDKNFGGATTTHNTGAEIVALSDRVLKVTIDRTLLKSDKSYMIDVASGTEQYVDLAKNVFDSKLYFRTVSNSEPIVTFETTFDLYEKDEYAMNSTSASKDKQTIAMTENDEDYLAGNAYREGVTVDNPNGQYIDLDSQPATAFNINDDFTMAGREGYKALNASKSNFYEIPGEYTITYNIPDPEDAALSSNAAQRTYKIFSRAYFTRGGATYSTLTATFTSGDMVEIYDDMQTSNITINEALEKALIKRYINDTSSADYLAAYRFNSKGLQENLAVSFDVSTVTDNAFADGYKGGMTLKAGESEQAFVLEIQSTSPDFEIEVDNSVFVGINSLSRSDARRFFNAKVRQKSTGKIVNYPLMYNFKNVHSNRYNVPQQVEITMIYPRGMENTINDIDMSVTRMVSVVLKKENNYKHPEDVEDYVGQFWDKVSDDVRDASTKKVLDYKLTYDEAARTPSDFFIVVKNHKGEPVNMTFPTGIALSFKPEMIQKEYAFVPGLSYNLAVEPMYDVFVSRDTSGGSAQQFYVPGNVSLPGALEVSLPIEEGMNTENLALYNIDEATNRYVLIEKIKDEQISDESITLEMTELRGQYVISDSELAGKIVGRV